MAKGAPKLWEVKIEGTKSVDLKLSTLKQG